jgi:hypothetical protein
VAPFAQQGETYVRYRSGNTNRTSASQEVLGQTGNNIAVEAGSWLGSEAGGNAANQTVFSEGFSLCIAAETEGSVHR